MAFSSLNSHTMYFSPAFYGFHAQFSSIVKMNIET